MLVSHPSQSSVSQLPNPSPWKRQSKLSRRARTKEGDGELGVFRSRGLLLFLPLNEAQKQEKVSQHRNYRLKLEEGGARALAVVRRRKERGRKALRMKSLTSSPR